MRIRFLAIATAAIIVSPACSPDRPDPSASLRRPSGLAYVERPDVDTLKRADLFIADSEAQGVRVIQLERQTDANNQDSFDLEFLAAPAVFFPLVIPAQGFPNRIVLSEDATRAYVLSPLSRQLHVIDARQQLFGAASTEEGARPLREPVSLEDATVGALLPVGLAILPGFGSSDVVLVAFDALDKSEGFLRAYRFDIAGTTVTFDEGSTESVAVQTAPRDLSVHDGNAVISSSLTNSISVVALNGAAPILGAATAIDAGGPTDAIIDAGPAGVLASRLDRASVVLFESTGGTMVRSTRRMASPYTSEEDRTSSAALGRLDLLDSNVVTGAHGLVGKFDIEPDEDIYTDILEPYRDLSNPLSTADVVGLVHLNGRMSFLFGPNVDLALVSRAAVARVTAFEGAVYVPECATTTIAATACVINTPPDPLCPDGFIILDKDENQVVRATYRGTLALGWSASIADADPNAADFTLKLSDPTGLSFEDRLVQLDDQVLISLEVPDKCGAGDGVYLDHVMTATITGIDGASLDLAMRTPEVFARRGCVAEWRVFSWEVYPHTDEVVVIEEGLGLEIQTVLQRVPVVRTGSVATASISRVVRATMKSDTNFRCVDEIFPAQPCTFDSDCQDLSNCTTADFCLARCASAECLPAAAGCTTQYPVRRCSSVEISVNQTSPYTLNLWAGQSFELGAAEDAVYSPQRRAFVVSFPGARELAEGFAAKDGTVGVRYIR